MEERLLEVKNLKVSFNVGKKKLTAVENVEFSLDKGKVCLLYTSDAADE